MRIAVAIFGFVLLALTLFVVAMPQKPGSQPGPHDAASNVQRTAEEPQTLTEIFFSYFPKGDRLAPPRSEEEVLAAFAEELASRRQPEGPPPPPPDVSTETLCHTLASVAVANGLPTGFFARLIWQESKFNPRIVSHAGAQGVAQFMPAVAAERGLLNPFDPLDALPHSGRFLKEHVKFFGNVGLAAAAYNAGTRRVTDWLARRGRLPQETRQYVRIITGHEPEAWIEPSEIDLAVALPRQNPCEGVADLSRDAEPAKIAVQLEPPVQRIIDSAREAAARAAANAKAKAKQVASSLKSKRGRMLAKAPGGKQKATDDNRRKGKAVAEKAEKPAAKSRKLPPKIADRLGDKPAKGRVRVADVKR